MKSFVLYSCLAAALPAVWACDSCYGPQDDVVHTRNVRRMQPGALGAINGPKAPLEWGQLNVLHTTDTHGWLEGHLKESNYGADWGDFVTFSRHLKHQAGNMGVDLLLIDTGDLHDGNGLSDATAPDGIVSNKVFEEVDYDVLTIGNHELYVTEIAYDTFANFSKVWGEKYVTSNVQIINPATGKFEFIGNPYYYFTTQQGLRIMAFGVLYDFTGNSNVSKVIKAKDLVTMPSFLEGVNYDKPIDLFLLIGHNPVRQSDYANTLGLVYKAIRAKHADTPIQIFGGHSHVRDFAIYDDKTTALESGRYCETLGWLAMSGIKSDTYKGNANPHGVPNPTRKAGNATSKSTTVYARRYLDWNRLTFEYHAVGSQSETFDYHSGLRVTEEITDYRNQLNLTKLYGCAPATYCFSCVPYGTSGSIFPVAGVALGATVINPDRKAYPRIIIANTGGIRFDLYKGPFTYDDSFTVSPFTDGFQYIKGVPYSIASQVLTALNNQPDSKKRDMESQFGAMPLPDTCIDPTLGPMSTASDLKPRGVKRSTQVLTPGYVTTDDFGTDGDDTPHSPIPNYPVPPYFEGTGGFTGTPAGTTPTDLIFLDYVAANVITALTSLGGKYTEADASYYLPNTGPNAFTTRDYLPAYAKLAWQAGVPNCPVS